MSQTYLDIFRQLNKVPRPSHHEERVADFLCAFAEEHGLKYRRDAQNCVVIEKPATPGCEKAEPVVILNHMDMVCVGRDGYLRDGRPFNPLTDEIRAYEEEVTNADGTKSRWMKAEGTSLGADNGMGLSMALAILANDSIVHPALEVLTTTNEEDGMSGAEGLSTDFIKGRRVINLDSEAYDEMTVGAAGACLQEARWKAEEEEVPAGSVFRRLAVEGGLGGHSGVDINKGRCNCIQRLCRLLNEGPGALVCRIDGGTANASIASRAEAVVAIRPETEAEWQAFVDKARQQVTAEFGENDPAVTVRFDEAPAEKKALSNAADVVACVCALPCGVQTMREDMPGTVMTSSNIGVLATTADGITLTTHTRSFDNAVQTALSDDIRALMLKHGAERVERLMNTGAWMEREDSSLLALTCETFRYVLGFEPKKVAMHFVLEAAYYVEKYPGVEIASIGPLIIEPHSTSERVNLDTADDIWKVTVELLRRLGTYKDAE